MKPDTLTQRSSKRKPQPFGARPCRNLRRRLFTGGVEALPKNFRVSWIIARIRNTPPWADFKEIRKVYAKAAEASARTGIPHHVDHDIPMQADYVSGLHVHENLVVKPAKANLRKGNRWLPGQSDLFDQPEQFDLFRRDALDLLDGAQAAQPEHAQQDGPHF